MRKKHQSSCEIIPIVSVVAACEGMQLGCEYFLSSMSTYEFRNWKLTGYCERLKILKGFVEFFALYSMRQSFYKEVVIASLHLKEKTQHDHTQLSQRIHGVVLTFHCQCQASKHFTSWSIWNHDFHNNALDWNALFLPSSCVNCSDHFLLVLVAELNILHRRLYVHAW